MKFLDLNTFYLISLVYTRNVDNLHKWWGTCQEHKPSYLSLNCLCDWNWMQRLKFKISIVPLHVTTPRRFQIHQLENNFHLLKHVVIRQRADSSTDFIGPAIVAAEHLAWSIFLIFRQMWRSARYDRGMRGFVKKSLVWSDVISCKHASEFARESSSGFRTGLIKHFASVL